MIMRAMVDFPERAFASEARTHRRRGMEKET